MSDKWSELGKRLQGYHAQQPAQGWKAVRKRMRRRQRRKLGPGLMLSILLLSGVVYLADLHPSESIEAQLFTTSEDTQAPDPAGMKEGHQLVAHQGARKGARHPATHDKKQCITVQGSCTKDTLKELIIPQNRMTREIHFLQNATYEEPENPRLYHRLALVYLEQKEYCKTQQNLAIARQLDCDRKVLDSNVDALMESLKSQTDESCVCYVDNLCPNFSH